MNRAKVFQTLADMSLSEGLDFLSRYLKESIHADRASIFIYCPKEERLWTLHADQSEKIEIPFDIGIVGQTLRTKNPVLENDPYDNPNFLADVDMQTGYYTQNVLTAPILNTKHDVLAIIQLLNREGGFSKKDRELLVTFARQIVPFIEKNL